MAVLPQGAQAPFFMGDEISEMPLALQAKLLRVLQQREVERVGGKKPIALDIRVLATSNRDMLAEVKAGSFREDLYYRLNVFPLEIPALRARPADVVPLARHFVALHGGRSGRQARLAAAAEAKLAAYGWPGNVRELENVMQRALILAPGATIEAEHLLFAGGAQEVLDLVTATQAQPPAAAPATVAAEAAATTQATGTGQVAAAAELRPAALGAGTARMEDLERQHILDTLAAVGGSRRLAVERLGISERTLRYKLKHYREQGYWQD